ncbi:DUF1524 domain-containing protein [Kitasatospora sp. NPDC058965]|uniref:GmrSD restriction endonuclease domain-containing protein n=1 Tax=Kitasatospora sp. NPDC058965 TaxID=3346682 RepID=UPI0036872D1E
MITSHRWRHAAAALLLSLATALAPATAASARPGTAPTPLTAGDRALPAPPSADQVRAEIDTLTIEAPHPMTGYSRAKFPHWAMQSGTCDTREIVLQRDGQDVVTDAQCRAVAGTWTSPYDGKTFTDSKLLDIDHIVPLANSWRSGADGWDTAKRKALANDLTHSQLVAVSATSNRSKGDQSPDQWKPPLQSYWCEYARARGDIKYLYGLNTTEPEKAAPGDMLDTCPTA